MNEIIGKSMSNNNWYSVVVTPHSVRDLFNEITKKLTENHIEFKTNLSNLSITFENNSVIKVLTSTNPDYLRGTRLDQCLIIDSKNVKDLDYLEKAVLGPALIYNGGKISYE